MDNRIFNKFFDWTDCQVLTQVGLSNARQKYPVLTFDEANDLRNYRFNFESVCLCFHSFQVESMAGFWLTNWPNTNIVPLSDCTWLWNFEQCCRYMWSVCAVDEYNVMGEQEQRRRTHYVPSAGLIRIENNRSDALPVQCVHTAESLLDPDEPVYAQHVTTFRTAANC